MYSRAALQPEQPVSTLLFACNGALKRVDKSNPTNVCIVTDEGAREAASPLLPSPSSRNGDGCSSCSAVRNEIFKLPPDIRTIWLMHLFRRSLSLPLSLSCLFLSLLKAHPKYASHCFRHRRQYISASAPAFCSI